MLLYHPARDGHHSAFRILRILAASNGASFERDTIRILDFLLIFPQAIAETRLPKDLKSFRSSFAAQKNCYHFNGSPRLVLLQMAPLQDMALRLLASRNLIELSLLLDSIVKRTEAPVPPKVSELIDLRNAEETTTVDFLVKHLATLPLSGPDGLKARTGLMEHRYDPS